MSRLRADPCGATPSRSGRRCACISGASTGQSHARSHLAPSPPTTLPPGERGEWWRTSVTLNDKRTIRPNSLIWRAALAVSIVLGYGATTFSQDRDSQRRQSVPRTARLFNALEDDEPAPAATTKTRPYDDLDEEMDLDQIQIPDYP